MLAKATAQPHDGEWPFPAEFLPFDGEGEPEPPQARHNLVNDGGIGVADAQHPMAVAVALGVEDAGKESLAPLGGWGMGPGNEIPDRCDAPTAAGSNRADLLPGADRRLEDELGRGPIQLCQVGAGSLQRFDVDQRQAEPVDLAPCPTGSRIGVGAE
ncbi:MAG TPA: hypothetical protein VF880_16470, partial [Actinomycetes bacterium]